MNYKIKLFAYLASIFLVFTIVVVVYGQIRENSYKREAFIEQMDIFSKIAQNDPTSALLPNGMRITLIGDNGRVSFDNSADTTQTLDNHFSRPEIAQAKKELSGWDIRLSQTMGKEFLYYARKTDNGYIRVALPYDIEVRSLLSSDKYFLCISLALFLISIVVLWFISKRFAQNMAHLNRKAERSQHQSEKLKSQMTSSIAHELRTPIATIRAYTETLLDGGLSDEKKQHFIERTHLSAVRLSDLVRDISLLSKLEEKKPVFDAQSIDINNVVRNVVSEYDILIRENSIKVENKLPARTLVKGNSTLIHSIFSNLIENSIKYGGKWITVTISLTQVKDGRIFVRIADTGVGVDEAHLPRLFERFYRVDTGRARMDGGSGLGLSIVRHAVIYHGGQISAGIGQSGGLVVDFDLMAAKS